MAQGSFFTPKEKVVELLAHRYQYGQEGIYAIYATDPTVLEKIMPPQVQPAAPVVLVYTINIQNSEFIPRFCEAGIGIPAVCNGEGGVYWLAFALDGPGSDMGIDVGREAAGMPKKLADKIMLRRMGAKAYASVTRHGITFMEIEMDITGEYPTEEAMALLGDPGAEETVPSPAILYHFGYGIDEEGKPQYTGGNFSQMMVETTYHTFEKGTATITFRDSLDDPWAELVCAKVLGAAWSTNDIITAWEKTLCDAPFDEVGPYIVRGRFDEGMLGQADQAF